MGGNYDVRRIATHVLAAYLREGQKPETRSAILADRQSGYGKQYSNVWGRGEIGKRASLGSLWLNTLRVRIPSSPQQSSDSRIAVSRGGRLLSGRHLVGESFSFESFESG